MLFYSYVHLRFEKLLLNEYVMLCYANRTVRYRETICPPPMAVQRWQKSRRFYVRPRTGSAVRSPRISQSINQSIMFFRVVQVTKSLQDPLEVGNNLPGISDNVRE